VNLGSTPPRPRSVLYLLLFGLAGVFVAQGIASANFNLATMIALNIVLAIAFAIVWQDDKTLGKLPIAVIVLLRLWVVFQLTATR